MIFIILNLVAAITFTAVNGQDQRDKYCTEHPKSIKAWCIKRRTTRQ